MLLLSCLFCFCFNTFCLVSGCGDFCFLSLLVLITAVSTAWFFKRDTYFSKASQETVFKQFEILRQLSHQLYSNFIEVSQPHLAIVFDKCQTFFDKMQDYFNEHFQT